MDAVGLAVQEALELVERRQGAPRFVVPQRGVVPVVGDALRGPVEAVFVGLGPPPIEAIDALVAVEHFDEVGGELALSLVGGGPGLRGVVVGIFWIPFVEIACLNNLDGLLGIGRLQVSDDAFERGQRAVEMGVVGQSDDVVIDGIGGERPEEAGHVLPRAQLGLNDDFRLGTGLATASDAGFQIAGEVGKGAAVIVAAVGIAMACGPEHSVGDFVAGLDEVGLGSGGLQCVERADGVVVEHLFEHGGVAAVPGRGRGVLRGVGPRVAIVEVEHEFQSGLLDALSELDDVVEVLANALALVVFRGFRGIDEQPHAHAVPAFRAEKREQVVDGLPVGSQILGSVFFVLAEQRDVAAEEFLPLRCRREGREKEREEDAPDQIFTMIFHSDSLFDNDFFAIDDVDSFLRSGE